MATHSPQPTTPPPNTETMMHPRSVSTHPLVSNGVIARKIVLKNCARLSAPDVRDFKIGRFYLLEIRWDFNQHPIGLQSRRPASRCGLSPWSRLSTIRDR